MSTTTVIAIYFLIWWMTLFAVLPWGVRSQEESGEVTPGTDPGAPRDTPGVAQIGSGPRSWPRSIFGILYVAYTSGLIPYDFLMAISSPPQR